MPAIKPFRALRPKQDLAASIVSPPYDVVDTQEARALAEGKPLSFLRVIRSEIEFSSEMDPYSHDVYAKARANLDKMAAESIFFYEEKPCLYVYRIFSGQHRQTGLVALCSVDDYLNEKIKKHELTVKVKEDDRTKHIDTVNANTGPVYLTYRDAAAPELAKFLDNAADTRPPLYDVTVENGDRHQIFRIDDAGEIAETVKHVAGLSALYIADGHHRAASAVRVGTMRRQNAGKHTGVEAFNFFMAVSFPDTQLRILPYNRVVRDLNGMSAGQFLAKIGEKFDIAEGKVSLKSHEMNMYLDGVWRNLKVKTEFAGGQDETKSLDVSILQNHILTPLLNIEDPRTSKRIAFVGGIRGDEELVRLVQGGEFVAAFSMFPTTMRQLLSVADAGKIMPPKSTWFEPKLKSGFLVHRLDY